MAECRRTWRQFVAELREKFPGKKPIRVRRCQMPFDREVVPNMRLCGDCEDKGDYFLIRINRDHTLAMQKDTVIHEWAHYLKPYERGGSWHHEEWGKKHAEIYREMVGD